MNGSRPEVRDRPVRPSHDPRTCFTGSHERIELIERLEIPVSPGMGRAGQQWPMRSTTENTASDGRLAPPNSGADRARPVHVLGDRPSACPGPHNKRRAAATGQRLPAAPPNRLHGRWLRPPPWRSGISRRGSQCVHPCVEKSAYMVLVDPVASEAAARSEVAPVRHGSVCQRTSSKVATSVSMP